MLLATRVGAAAAGMLTSTCPGSGGRLLRRALTTHPILLAVGDEQGREEGVVVAGAWAAMALRVQSGNGVLTV